MLYRQEHPRPQFIRKDWKNLNGEWDFEIDHSISGDARGLMNDGAAFSRKIQVPFCPESKLSGVEYVDFMRCVWYRRSFTATPEQLQGRILLHFGAVDYEANVYINGQLCGSHKGGYSSFHFDITEYVVAGENTLVVQALDDTRDPLIPSGKQCHEYASKGCMYTRSTGIWQTVWLEYVPKTYIVSTKYTTDIEAGTVHISATVIGNGEFKAEAFYNGKPMGSARTTSYGGCAQLTINLSEIHLWEAGNGRLYDLVLTYGEDRVESYFGLRSLTLDGHRFLLNGKSFFQRLVLDQGYYPDGIYTAPCDEDLVKDIQRGMDMGFDGARLHERVFEERYLYHCDRMGYLVWGEYPNWGLDHCDPAALSAVLPEWIEVVQRDFNHPAIVGWCPFNETSNAKGRPHHDALLANTYKVTKAIDPTRPCIDTSGYFHVITDIFDVHTYQQDPEAFTKYYESMAVDGTFYDFCSHSQTPKKGQPMFVSEYGGIGFSLDESAWGYGNAPTSREEYLQRLKGLTDVLLDNPYMMGLCYTQLYDVEQEQNGLYTYSRQPKFSPEEIAPIFRRKAAIEEI